jgi:hypothetical protein
MDELQGILGMVGDAGFWVVFAYLFINERKAHERTREAYRDDLRSAAGFGALLRHPASQQDTQPLPELST